VTDNHATTPFSYRPSTTFLHIRPHCMNASRNKCQDLNSFLFGELVTTRTPSYYVDEDLKSNNLSLIEAIDVAQNHPLWRLMFMFGATHS